MPVVRVGVLAGARGYARVVADGAARGRPLLVVLSMRWFRCLEPLCAKAGLRLATTLTAWQGLPRRRAGRLLPRPVGSDRNRDRLGQVRDHDAWPFPWPAPALVVPAPGHSGDAGPGSPPASWLRIQGCQACRDGSSRLARRYPLPRQAQTPVTPPGYHSPSSPPRGRPRDDPDPAPANASAAILSASADLASLRILACLLPVRPLRHRERRTKCRQQFPFSPAAGRYPPAPARSPSPSTQPGRSPTPMVHRARRMPRWPSGRRRRHLLTSPACANHTQGGKPRPGRGTGASPWAISGPLSSHAVTAKHPGNHLQAYQGRYNSKNV